MSITIYPKTNYDLWVHLKEIGVSNGDENEELEQLSSSNSSFVKLLSEGMNLSWGDWDEIHSLLFDSYDGDKISFCRDDVGFIPPHILTEILKSEKFKSKYNQIRDDYEEELEVEFLHIEDEENYSEPDYHLIDDYRNKLEIWDFIMENEKWGIVYN